MGSLKHMAFLRVKDISKKADGKAVHVHMLIHSLFNEKVKEKPSFKEIDKEMDELRDYTSEVQDWVKALGEDALDG